jgi:hypothetical protein
MSDKDVHNQLPELRLREMLSAGWMGRCIYVAVKWDLITQFDEGESLTEICRRIGWHHDRSLRFVKALESLGLLTDQGDDHFAVTDLGKLLLPNPTGGVADMAILYGEEYFQSWARLTDVLASDASGFELCYGVGFFPYTKKNAEFGRRYERAMRGIAEMLYAEIPRVCDWSTVSHVIDVGGGNGFLLTSLLKAFPHLSGTLYDQPEVVSAAERLIACESNGLRDRVRVVGGDFFGSVPKGGDCILLSNILHDFDDEHAVEILRNCADVLPSGGKLRLVEPTLRSDEGSTRARYLDLHMMVLHGGRERTEDEFKTLLEAAGLGFVRSYNVKKLTCVIEAQRPLEQTSHSRNVLIKTTMEKVRSFLAEVGNLPRWTRFFRDERQIDPERMQFSTPIGPCVTRVLTHDSEIGFNCQIVSQFDQRREEALLVVERQGETTLVEFFMNIPITLPEDKRTALLTSLEGELQELKKILEDQV